MNRYVFTLALAAIACSVAQAADTAPALGVESPRVLWAEAFTNDGRQFGWEVVGLRPTREAMGLRLELDSNDKTGGPCMSRYLTLRLADIRDEVIYSQFFISEVGGDRMTMWLPPCNMNAYNPGHHPGLWTVPYKLKPAAATSEYYRVNFYGSGYVTLRFIRLVTGATPLPNSALWQRDGAADWARPAVKGDHLRVVANLGSRAKPPAVTFVVSSFNCYRPVDVTGAGVFATLTMNDSGRDGDAASGDGLWTVMLVFDGAAKYPAGVVTAVVRFDDGESDVTYAKAPWAFEPNMAAKSNP